MAVKDILLLGNPILWKVSNDVKDFGSPKVISLIQDLKDTLIEFRNQKGFGRGIAAPQISSLLRIIYIHLPDVGFSGPLINPAIIAADKKVIELWDDCFSFPDLMVKVRRSKSITVKYFDENGDIKFLEVSDLVSELLQHEIDHLNGILAVQRAISPTSFALRSEWEKVTGAKL